MEERFRALVEGAQDLIFMKDRHLTYTHVNPAMARMLGLDVSEIIGRKDEDIFDRQPGNISNKWICACSRENPSKKNIPLP